jgi:hypothetical protein
LRKECVLYVAEDEDAIHILLKCSETRKWRGQFLRRKWLVVHEWIAYKKIINCSNIIQLRNIGIHLHKIKCKWENKPGIYDLSWGGVSITVVII